MSRSQGKPTRPPAACPFWASWPACGCGRTGNEMIERRASPKIALWSVFGERRSG